VLLLGVFVQASCAQSPPPQRRGYPTAPPPYYPQPPPPAPPYDPAGPYAHPPQPVYPGQPPSPEPPPAYSGQPGGAGQPPSAEPQPVYPGQPGGPAQPPAVPQPWYPGPPGAADQAPAGPSQPPHPDPASASQQPSAWYPPAAPGQPGWQQPAHPPPWPAHAQPPAYAPAGGPGAPSRPRAADARVLAEDTDKKFLLRPFIGISSLGLSLTPDEDPDVDLSPNTSTVMGLRGGYTPFVVSASFGIGEEQDAEVYGKSGALDFQFSAPTRVGGRELLGTVFFQQYKNFFASNMEELGIDPAQPYRLPNMFSRNVGLAATLFTDPKFSYDDTFLEGRARSATEATWAFRLSLGYHAFDTGGQSLIPVEQRMRFGRIGQIHALDSRYASFSVGWASDWRLGKGFFIGMSGLLGLTAAARISRVGTEKFIEPAFGPSVTLHIITGYAGDTFHWGYLGTADLESTNFDDTGLSAIRGLNMLYIGIRL
jgi:hypothetical protein